MMIVEKIMIMMSYDDFDNKSNTLISGVEFLG